MFVFLNTANPSSYHCPNQKYSSMKSTIYYLLFAFFSVWSTDVKGQSDIKSYSLKKGQAFDILFLKTIEGSEETRKRYFDTAIPVAMKTGYGPLKGFKVKAPLKGDYAPESMILGSWPSIQVREQFLADIEKEVPDFHSMRKEIWSTFDLTYWEIKEDLAFDVNTTKYNVVTSFWGDKRYVKSFQRDWIGKSIKSGGKTIFVLEEGTSPKGYEYNPDFLILTQWDSEEAYQNLIHNECSFATKKVKIVHQLSI